MGPDGLGTSWSQGLGDGEPRVRKPALSCGQHELGGLRLELAGMGFDSARGDIHTFSSQLSLRARPRGLALDSQRQEAWRTGPSCRRLSA